MEGEKQTRKIRIFKRKKAQGKVAPAPQDPLAGECSAHCLTTAELLINIKN